MGVTKDERRWTHTNGGLALCQEHAEPILAKIPTHWYEMLDFQLDQYKTVIGEPMPCDFCTIEQEYEIMDSTLLEGALETLTIGEPLDI
jgi:hypothetical protein